MRIARLRGALLPFAACAAACAVGIVPGAVDHRVHRQARPADVALAPALPEPTSGALRFLRLGAEHILSGFDHVLFLVSLLVAMPRRRDLIATISAFTLGHTATLVLATLRLFVLPPAIVEPAIALSVLYVSIENVAGSPGRHRAWLACAFGLVHGMGFSGALSGLHLSGGALAAALASFNAGVEAGQLLIVAAVCPLLAWWHARRPERCRRIALQGGSIAIAVVAAAWFLERV